MSNQSPEKTKIQSRNRVTIPEEVLEGSPFDKGDELWAYPKEDKIILRDVTVDDLE